VPGRFYAPGHTWAAIRDDGDVRVGIDALARKALGRPDSVEMPVLGQQVEKGEPVVTFLRDEKRLTFRSPVSGTVVAVNASPSSAAAGNWFFTVQPAQLAAEIRGLKIAEEAVAWLREEAARFRDFLVESFRASPAFATLPDGGVPADGVLGVLPEEAWTAFEDDFLSADR
jgi:glycine cleavage system H lipoate-binding protein